jgi:F420-0:gamma-glutamyl ligase
MTFTTIKTCPMLPPQDDLYAILDIYINDIQDGDVVFITSKIIAIHQ